MNDQSIRDSVTDDADQERPDVEPSAPDEASEEASAPEATEEAPVGADEPPAVEVRYALTEPSQIERALGQLYGDGEAILPVALEVDTLRHRACRLTAPPRCEVHRSAGR